MHKTNQTDAHRRLVAKARRLAGVLLIALQAGVTGAALAEPPPGTSAVSTIIPMSAASAPASATPATASTAVPVAAATIAPTAASVAVPAVAATATPATPATARIAVAAIATTTTPVTAATAVPAATASTAPATAGIVAPFAAGTAKRAMAGVATAPKVGAAAPATAKLNDDGAALTPPDLSLYRSQHAALQKLQEDNLQKLQEDNQALKLEVERTQLQAGTPPLPPAPSKIQRSAKPANSRPYLINLTGLGDQRKARIAIPGYGPITVQPGDVLPNHWRIKSIDDDGVVVQTKQGSQRIAYQAHASMDMRGRASSGNSARLPARRPAHHAPASSSVEKSAGNLAQNPTGKSAVKLEVKLEIKPPPKFKPITDKTRLPRAQPCNCKCRKRLPIVLVDDSPELKPTNREAP